MAQTTRKESSIMGQCRATGVLFVAATTAFMCLVLLYFHKDNDTIDSLKWMFDRLNEYWIWLFAAGFSAETAIALWVGVLAARRQADREIPPRAVDGVPMYLFGGLCAIIFSLSLYILFLFFSDNNLSALRDWTKLLGVLPVLIASAFMLYLLLTTVVVRLKSPDWWQRTQLYKLFVLGSLEQRARALLWFATLLEFMLMTAVYLLINSSGIIPAKEAETRHMLSFISYILLDLAFVLIEVLYIYIIGRSVFSLIHGTHRIVREKKGLIDLEGLQDQSRVHAENINILSRNANAHTEQRYINESFSIRLINNVSRGLRGPLHAVAENVRLLEAGGLSPQAEQESIRRIGTLSEELKKTIEDLIRVSRASTGVIEADPVPTDVVEMMNQALGEYYERFEDRQLEPVIETPPLPLLIRADGEFMWNVFDGILSAIEADGVPGTRVFLSARESREHVLVLFRATVRPPEEEKVDLSAENGLGLPFAKVYAELQGGDVFYKYGKETLTVALRFPAFLRVQEV